MPIYEYACKNCGTHFERMQPVTAAPVTECDNCGRGPVRRVFHPVGVIFKGSGWYVTDSRKPAKSKDDGGAKTESGEKTSTKGGAEKESTSAPSESD